MTTVYMYSMGIAELWAREGATQRPWGGPEIEVSYTVPGLRLHYVEECCGRDGWLEEILVPLYTKIREKLKELVKEHPQAMLFWVVPPCVMVVNDTLVVWSRFRLWLGAAEDIHPHDHKNYARGLEFNWTGFNDLSVGAMHRTEV